MVFVDEVLKEEKLLLQTRVLPLNLVHVKHAKILNISLLSGCMKDGVAHEERARVNAQYYMFISDGVLHSRESVKTVAFAT